MKGRKQGIRVALVGVAIGALARRYGCTSILAVRVLGVSAYADQNLLANASVP